VLLHALWTVVFLLLAGTLALPPLGIMG